MKQIIISLVLVGVLLSSCVYVNTTPNENKSEIEGDILQDEDIGDEADKQKTQSYKLGEEIIIPIRKTITLHDTNMKIMFHELISDSRCPDGVQCFCEGVAEVSIRVMFDDEEITQKIEISPSWEGTLLYELGNDFKMEVLSLDPYPSNLEKIKKDQYMLQVIITK